MKSTIEIARELKGMKVGKVFDAIDGRFTSKYEFEYSDLATTIMDIVARGAEGFVKDIAERFSSIYNTRVMSDKQRWCVAFAFQKVSDEVIEAYDAECKAALDECMKENEL